MLCHLLKKRQTFLRTRLKLLSEYLKFLSEYLKLLSEYLKELCRPRMVSTQTSKDVGVNVEGDLDAEDIVHTFALS